MMTEEHISTPNICLPTGSKAPMFDTQDIEGKDLSLTNLLENHRGVLIDFFRGGWCPNISLWLPVMAINPSESKIFLLYKRIWMNWKNEMLC